MNNCNRLVPACYRLGNSALVPSRTIFSRRGLIPWNFMERQMEEIDRQFARMERDMNSAFRELGFPFPRVRTFFEPSSSIPSLTSRMFPTIEAQTSPSTEAGKPGKYSVRVSQDGNSRIYQEVSRSFTLPEGINPEDVKSLLTPEGILTIEAPLPEVELPQPKEIPISIEAKTN